MTRVGFILPGIDRIGGAERQALLLARGLAARGWTVSIVALSGTGAGRVDELAQDGVEFVSLGMRKGLADLRGWIRFHRWVNQWHPDVLHAHLPHAAWMACGSRFFAPVRALVETVHSPAAGGFWMRATHRITRRLPDCVTAVGQGVANAMLATGTLRPERLAVIQNAVDLDEMKPDAAERARVRGELGLANEFLWLAAGRLEPVKDYPALLRAFAGLPPASWLAIAGTGWQEPELRRLTEQLGLDSRVRFLGFQENIRRWMQGADGVVLASRWEGLPLSLLEAGACGLPSVATETAGAREIEVDGLTGFLCSADRPGALRAAMLRLMSLTPEQRLGMGLDARQHIAEHFGLEAALERWETLCRDLLGRNPSPRRSPRRD